MTLPKFEKATFELNSSDVKEAIAVYIGRKIDGASAAAMNVTVYPDGTARAHGHRQITDDE